MIEFRWLKISHGIEGHSTTLQYRLQVHPDAAHSYENGKAWGAWKDVPVVEAT